MKKSTLIKQPFQDSPYSVLISFSFPPSFIRACFRFKEARTRSLDTISRILDTVLRRLRSKVKAVVENSATKCSHVESRVLPWRVWNCIAFVYLFHGTIVESPPEIRLALAARGFRSIDRFDRHFHLIIRSSNEEACSARYNVSSNVRVNNRYRFDDVA